MTRIFISDATVEDYASDGKYNVRFAAHRTSVNFIEQHTASVSANGQPNSEPTTIVNLQYSVKAIVKDTATTAEIMQPNLKDVYIKSANETISAKLSEIPMPKLTLSNFKNAEEFQNYLHDYYLQYTLNKLGKFGTSNWTEKQ